MRGVYEHMFASSNILPPASMRKNENGRHMDGREDALERVTGLEPATFSWKLTLYH